MIPVRRIIHLDLDAFFCAVEEQLDPSLRGKPFAVGGSPQGRGVVASCSYAARQFGVRSAMPMIRALKLCPSLKVVRHNFSEYTRASRDVMRRMRDLTEEVEQISIDEAFIEITDHVDPVEIVAHRLQTQIWRELGLPCSLGVASNKLVAKIATNVGKMSVKGSGPPNALTIIPPGTEASFLAPLPVEMLWGVGPKTAQKLAKDGVKTIGDLADVPEINLVQSLGKLGHSLARRSQGIDKSPIVTSRQAKSVSNERTFARDVRDEYELRRALKKLSERVAKRLKKNGLSGRTIKIKLRWHDFTTLTRQATLNQPVDDSEIIYGEIARLFEKIWKPGRAVRLLGVGVSGLVSLPLQLSLWDCDVKREERLQTALAEVQSRFGKHMLSRGVKS